MRKDGAANRERILVAAEQVFGVGGTAASTEEVARRAQVGVATVFRHFPSKQDLLEATALRYLDAVAAQISTLTDETDPGAALAAAMRVLVSTGPTKVTLLHQLMTDTGELSDIVLATVRAVRELVGRVLGRAQQAGAARPDATTDDAFTLARALAHVVSPDDDAALNRALDYVLDGFAVRR